MTIAFLLVAALTGAQPVQKLKGEHVKLWSAICVIPEPIFDEARTQNLQIRFALVNDGNTTVNPRIDDSHLFINGVEPEDGPFGRVVRTSNAPRTSLFYALPPGQSLRFGYMLGSYFGKPGIYNVRWEGKDFRSRELVFRVLPRHATHRLSVTLNK